MNLPPDDDVPLPPPPPAGPDGDPQEPVKGSFRIKNMLSTVNRTILAAGTVIGNRYHIIEEIDRGGMAVVYKALQLDLKREVALKVMPANVTINYRFVERFLAEAHSVAKLNHTGIVNIYEVATENNIYFIAMEYIPGKNLYTHLNEYKPKLVDVLEIVSKLTEALSYAHSQKIIHRDLKLNNVIMRDPLTPVLIDFGLAKALEDSDSGGGITRTGEIMGSPAYMAPERLLGGEVDQRSDICSLGIMLYEMLTFKNPYLDQRNLHQTTYNVMEANPIPPKKLIPWLSADIEAITLKAMAKDPAMRYQTMDEFREDIKRYRDGEAVLAKPPSLKRRSARFMRKKWAPITIIALILLFSGVIATSYFLQRKKVYSHWQLVYAQPAVPQTDEWAFADIDTLHPGKFEEAGRTFSLSSPGLSYVRLERRFNRDLLVEFDVRAPDKNMFRLGIFLFGENPAESHCVYLNRDGFGESGIAFPGSDLLFHDVETGAIPWQESNRITIERLNNSISLIINGAPVARVFDFFQPIGKAHEKIGFFVDGTSAVFSNIRVHRRAIPQTPSPTLIADRFRERGDFESAIDEYNGLMVDRSAINLTKEIHLNIAECQIRLGLHDEALSTLEKAAQLPGSDALKARARYLSGVAFIRMEDSARAENAFAAVTRQFKTSPVNFSVMASAMARSAAMYNSGNTEGALAAIKAGIEANPKFAPHWGRLHLKILGRVTKQGNMEASQAILNEITAIHGSTSETVVRARLILAEAYLNAGQIAPASQIYNQSIHRPTVSDNVWFSWYALGELYDYDFDYEQAQALYSKVWKECPPTSVTHWLAAIKVAEQAVSDTMPLERVPLLHEIAGGPHPFPLPRIIAAYYLDKITEIEFQTYWESLFPGDSWCLYYIARKLLLQGNPEEAVSVLRVLQRQLPMASWHTFQVLKILHSTERWR
ncbi:MAG: serine/threonine-protein kinase [Chitinispirillia bacterium]|nr:serine/threonine-protein kinase [Chitinispirillia bacterium]MCL2241464.1 serine/threonine-protein kinase [Chitinispirillia bacterium]